MAIYWINININLKTSVSDPYWSQCGSGSSKNLNTDPDPTFFFRQKNQRIKIFNFFKKVFLFFLGLYGEFSVLKLKQLILSLVASKNLTKSALTVRNNSDFIPFFAPLDPDPYSQYGSGSRRSNQYGSGSETLVFRAVQEIPEFKTTYARIRDSPFFYIIQDLR